MSFSSSDDEDFIIDSLLDFDADDETFTSEEDDEHEQKQDSGILNNINTGTDKEVNGDNLQDDGFYNQSERFEPDAVSKHQEVSTFQKSKSLDEKPSTDDSDLGITYETITHEKEDKKCMYRLLVLD